MSNRLKLSLIALSIGFGISAVYVYVVSSQYAKHQTAAMTLIRDMDNIDQKLWQASQEFGFALKRFLTSPDASGSDGHDSGAVRQSHHTLVQFVNQSIAVVSRLEAPDSEHGEAFIAAQRKFLLVQRKIIRKDFGQLLKLLDDPSIAPSQRSVSILEILDAAYQETDREFASVHAARERFANEFAIHLAAQQ